MNLTIDIPLEPMTLNMAYPTNKSTGGRSVSPRARAYKKAVFIIVRNALVRNQDFRFDPSKHYMSMSIVFRSPSMIAKEDKRKKLPKRLSQIKPDTSNCIKLLEDSICDAMNIDDHYNLDFDFVHFRYAEKAMTTVTITLNPIENVLDN